MPSSAVMQYMHANYCLTSLALGTTQLHCFPLRALVRPEEEQVQLQALLQGSLSKSVPGLRFYVAKWYIKWYQCLGFWTRFHWFQCHLYCRFWHWSKFIQHRLSWQTNWFRASNIFVKGLWIWHSQSHLSVLVFVLQCVLWLKCWSADQLTEMPSVADCSELC